MGKQSGRARFTPESEARELHILHTGSHHWTYSPDQELVYYITAGGLIASVTQWWRWHSFDFNSLHLWINWCWCLCVFKLLSKKGRNGFYGSKDVVYGDRKSCLSCLLRFFSFAEHFKEVEHVCGEDTSQVCDYWCEILQHESCVSCAHEHTPLSEPRNVHFGNKTPNHSNPTGWHWSFYPLYRLLCYLFKGNVVF